MLVYKVMIGVQPIILLILLKSAEISKFHYYAKTPRLGVKKIYPGHPVGHG
jgi:hypothetical protein